MNCRWRIQIPGATQGPGMLLLLLLSLGLWWCRYRQCFKDCMLGEKKIRVYKSEVSIHCTEQFFLCDHAWHWVSSEQPVPQWDHAGSQTFAQSRSWIIGLVWPCAQANVFSLSAAQRQCCHTAASQGCLCLPVWAVWARQIHICLPSPEGA